MTLKSGFTGTDHISQPPLQVGGRRWLTPIGFLCVRNSISCTEKLNFDAFNYCSSYSESNRNHRISPCLLVFLMKLCTQTLFSLGYTELVRLTVCPWGVAALLLKDCIMQQDLLLSAEITISKWLLWLFCWWQICEVLIPIFRKTSSFFSSIKHR